jgi:xylulokinase
MEDIFRTNDYTAEQAAIDEKNLGKNHVFFLPYLMGERTPILDSNARAVFFGLSAMHNKIHLARAVIEGVSYSLYSCLEILKKMNIELDDMALCGGGGKSRFWQQMLCDIYAMPIKTMQSDEGAALGAAILGGCAAGVYSSVADGCDKTVKAKEPCLPDLEKMAEYRKFYSLYSSLYTALKDSFKTLDEI